MYVCMYIYTHTYIYIYMYNSPSAAARVRPPRQALVSAPVRTLVAAVAAFVALRLVLAAGRKAVCTHVCT